MILYRFFFLFFFLPFSLYSQEVTKPHWQWGNTELIPKIISTVEYDDNVNLEKDETNSDSIISLISSLSLNSKLSHNKKISIEYKYLKTFYAKSENKDEESDNHFLNLSGNFNFSNNWELVGKGLMEESREILDEFDQRDKFLHTNIKTVLKRESEASMVAIEGEYDLEDEHENVVFKTLERDKKILSFKIAYKKARAEYGVELNFGDENFFVENLQDNFFSNVYVSYKNKLFNRLRFEVKAGYKEIKFEGSDDEGSMIGEFKWVHEIRERLSFSFISAYDFDTSSFTGTINKWRNEMNWEYKQKWSFAHKFGLNYLNAKANLTNIEIDEEGQSEVIVQTSKDYDQYKLNYELSYKGLKRCELSFFYSFTLKESDENNDNYKRNHFGTKFQLTW